MRKLVELIDKTFKMNYLKASILSILGMICLSSCQDEATSSMEINNNLVLSSLQQLPDNEIANQDAAFPIGTLKKEQKPEIQFPQKIEMNPSAEPDLLETILFSSIPEIDRPNYALNASKNGFFVIRDYIEEDEKGYYLGAELTNLESGTNELFRVKLTREGDLLLIDNSDRDFGQFYRCKSVEGYFSVDIDGKDGRVQASCYLDNSKEKRIARDQETLGE